MSLIARNGAYGFPATGGTIEVYDAGTTNRATTVESISGLTDAGSDLISPFVLDSSEFWEIEMTDFADYDILWVEQAKNIVKGIQIRSVVIGTDVQAHSTVLDNTTASFTTEEKTKLGTVETNADVTDTENVTSAGALMDSEVNSLSGVKTLTISDNLSIDQDLTVASEPEFAATTFTPGLGLPVREEGKLFYDDERKSLGLYIDETEFTWQISREIPLRVWNPSPSETLLNGRVASVIGVGLGSGTLAVPYIYYGSADYTIDIGKNTVGIITHDIEPESFGEVTVIGYVNDIDTSAPLVAGEIAWLAATVPPDGTMTATKPPSPHYAMEMGGVVTGHATAGIIFANYLPQGNKDDVDKVFNGSILEHHNVDANSDGVNIQVTLDNPAAENYLSLFFDAEFFILDTPASINIAQGTDISPVLNYVYVDYTTKVLAYSTTGWPSNQHVPVATVLCKSAATTVLENVLKLHAWTDHLSSGIDQGHIADLNKWIRNQNATWLSGCVTTIDQAVPTDVTLSITSGNILQLHEHTFPAFADPADIYVVNDPAGAYSKYSSLNAALSQDSTGATLDNRAFTAILWGSVSEHDDQCKLFINLPSGSYAANNPDSANTDLLGYTNGSIPSHFKGTGFMIRKIICSWNPAGTDLTVYTTYPDDLRGQPPLSLSGGSWNGSGGALPAGGNTNQVLAKVSPVDDDADWVDVRQRKFEINPQTGIVYTPVFGDEGKIVTCDNVVPFTFWIPLDSTTSFEVGTFIDVEQKGSGQLTISPVGGVTLQTSDGLTGDIIVGAQFSVVRLIKVGADTWLANAGGGGSAGYYIRNETGTSYTPEIGDENDTHITLTNILPITFTVPDNASVAYAIGARLSLSQKGAGLVTITPAGGVTLVHRKGGTGAIALVGQYSVAEMIKIDTDTWEVYGSLAYAGGTSTVINRIDETISGASKSSFSIAYDTALGVEVYQNGIRLEESAYTATSGSAVVLDTAAEIGEHVTISGYVDLDISPNTKINRVDETVSGSAKDTFTIDYDQAVGPDVFVNGTKLQPDAFTASSGTSVILDTPAAVGAHVSIIGYQSFVVADAYTKTEIDTNHYTKSETDALRPQENLLINGDFDIWQRGTALSNTTGYLADRWYFESGVGGTVSIYKADFLAGGNDTPPGAKHALAVSYSVGSTVGHAIGQKIEDVRSVTPGRKVTATFWINSDKDVAIQPQLKQNFGSGGSAEVSVVGDNFQTGVQAGGIYNKYKVAFDLPSIVGKTIGTDSFVHLRLADTDTGAHTIVYAQFKLEIGAETPFIPRPVAEELALCQRYYWKGQPTSAFAYRYGTTGAANYFGGGVHFPSEMRAIPTVTTVTAPSYQNCTLADIVALQNYFDLRVNITANGNFRINGGIFEADAEL